MVSRQCLVFSSAAIKVLNYEFIWNFTSRMWRLVIILIQLVIYVISEDVANLTTEIDRATNTEANIPLLRWIRSTKFINRIIFFFFSEVFSWSKINHFLRIPLTKYERFDSRDSAKESKHRRKRREQDSGIFMRIGKLLKDTIAPETSMEPSGA